MTDISQNDPTPINLDDATLDTGGFDWLLPTRKKKQNGTTKTYKKKFSLNEAQIKERIGNTRPYTVVSLTEEQKQNALDMARARDIETIFRRHWDNTVPPVRFKNEPK